MDDTIEDTKIFWVQTMKETLLQWKKEGLFSFEKCWAYGKNTIVIRFNKNSTLNAVLYSKKIDLQPEFTRRKTHLRYHYNDKRELLTILTFMSRAEVLE